MDNQLKDPEFRPKWENRKRVIFLSLIFCAFCILYVMLTGEDTKLNETIVTMSFIAAISIIGSYVFGAAWDDKNVMKGGK